MLLLVVVYEHHRQVGLSVDSIPWWCSTIKSSPQKGNVMSCLLGPVSEVYGILSNKTYHHPLRAYHEQWP